MYYPGTITKTTKLVLFTFTIFNLLQNTIRSGDIVRFVLTMCTTFFSTVHVLHCMLHQVDGIRSTYTCSTELPVPG